MISVLYDDYSNLNKLFDENYKYNKSHNMYINHSMVNNINNEDIQELIQNTIKIINQHYFIINPSRYYIEFHKYLVNGKKNHFLIFIKMIMVLLNIIQ